MRIFLLILCIISTTTAYADTSASKNSEVVVIGKSHVKLEADLADITFSISGSGSSATNAEKIIQSKIGKLPATLNLQLMERSLDTGNAKYKAGIPVQIVDQYMASHIAISKVSSIQDLIVSQQGAEILSVNIRPSHTAQSLKAAYSEALDQAKALAAASAKATGLKLGKLTQAFYTEEPPPAAVRAQLTQPDGLASGGKELNIFVSAHFELLSK